MISRAACLSYQRTERIAAAVEAANECGDSFVVCARADRVMHEGQHALDESIDRLRCFAKVGAHCLYAPGPTDEASLRRIVAEAGGPVNALFRMDSGLTVADATKWGVQRVSIGSSLYEATMAVFLSMVTQIMKTGSFEVDIRPLDYEYIESLCR